MAVVSSGGSILTASGPLSAPTIPRGVTWYGGTAQDYAAIYRTQPNVRLVIRFLGRNIAQLGLKAFVRVSDTERRSLPKDHELGAWLKNPTPIAPVKMTRHKWIRALVEDLATYDMSLHLKMRNPETGLLSAVRVPPTHFLPIGDSILWPEKFRVFGAGGPLAYRDYDPADVIYLSGQNPTDSRVGCSPIEAIRAVLAEDVAASEARAQFWRNAGRQSGVIERPLEAPKWTDGTRERFLSDFRAANTGRGENAGGTVVLEEGMTYVATSFSAKDSEYLGARRLSREEVAAQWFIPPVFVGILENANFANVREQHRSLYSDTLGPWLDWITEDLEAQLVPEFSDVDDVYLDFNIAAKLEGSFEEQAAALSTTVGAPTMTRNEGRARQNLPPVEGGDELVTPLNVLVGGLASPRDTAPPPAGTLALPAPAGRQGAKAALAPELRGWEAKHAEILSGFFARQRDSVIAKLGAGHELDVAFDADRWNGELGDDLFALAVTMAEDVAAPVAEDLGGEYDPALALAYLETNARTAAEGINATTFAELGTVWSGAPRRGQASAARSELDRILVDAGFDETDDPEDPFGESFLDPARNVFAVAIAARALQIATSRATAVGQFSRHEGASQAGARTKTWVGSGSPASRHADVDGETVAIGDTFSNGAQWPGDPALGVDQTAGCLCSLDFGT